MKGAIQSATGPRGTPGMHFRQSLSVLNRHLSLEKWSVSWQSRICSPVGDAVFVSRSAELTDLPAKPSVSLLSDGLLHCSYPSLSNPLRCGDPESFETPGSAFWNDGPSDDAWLLQHLRDAVPFDVQLSYLFRDNDEIYSDMVSRFRVRTGIEEVKTA